MSEEKKVLMVCLGNICRSPIAEAVFIDYVDKMKLHDSWKVDSAAIIGYHTGKTPDRRAITVLRNRGITDYAHRARVITEDDFYNFDWIFGMDDQNIADLNQRKPTNATAKIELLGKYDPNGETIIRDPYYDNGTDSFETVYDQCVRCIQCFINQNAGNS